MPAPVPVMLPRPTDLRREAPAAAVQAPLVASAPYVTIDHAAIVTGYTAKAIERKIERGEWVEGREWVMAPDGRRLVSMRGFAAWVERGRK